MNSPLTGKNVIEFNRELKLLMDTMDVFQYKFLYLNLYLPTRSTNDWVLYSFSPLKTPQNIKLNVIQQIQVQLWIIYNMSIQLQKITSFVQTNRSTVVEFDINFNNRIYKN